MGYQIGLEAEEYDREYQDRKLVGRILSYFKPYKKPMLVVVIFLTIGSLTTAFVPVLISLIINTIATSRDPFLLILAISLIFLFNFSGWIFNYFQSKNTAQVVGDVVLDIRKDANQAVLNHDLSFFDKNPIGKIVSRMNSDSRDFGQTVELSMQVLSSVLVIIILIFILLVINPFLTLIFLITIPLFFVIALSFRKLARKTTLLGQRALATVNAYVKESFSGIQVAKTFRQEEKIHDRFNDINEQSYHVNLKRAFVLISIFPSLGLIQGVILTLIVYFGGTDVIIGNINAGDFNLFFQSLYLLFFPLLTIASFWPQFQAGLSASERIFALIDANPQVVQTNDIKPDRFKGKIEIKNLTFRYEEGKDVYKNFSLSIQPGESVAIVGHTGAGKSSLANLLARFYEFQEGVILIDGISIKEFDLTAYRKQIGLIPQSPFLWAETLENNISYCCEATREEIIHALDSSGGSEWIEDLPKGLETNVGERGSMLSMGQRQLVVFARVLLENPSILILDEATASVDPFTETLIQDALQETIKGRTSIVIAHRLWTVRHVDRIIVLDHGKIIEEGNHEELITKKGKYAELYDTYFRHQSLDYIDAVKDICS